MVDTSSVPRTRHEFVEHATGLCARFLTTCSSSCSRFLMLKTGSPGKRRSVSLS